MSKFKPSGATVHRTKRAAKSQASKLRKRGYRAEVQETAKITRKRSPNAKWVCFRGQRRI